MLDLIIQLIRLYGWMLISYPIFYMLFSFVFSVGYTTLVSASLCEGSPPGLSFLGLIMPPALAVAGTEQAAG